MPFDPRRTLVFMHVAKSSGTALDAGLTEALSPKRRACGFDGVMFGGFRDFATLSDQARAEIHHHPWSLPDADYVHGHLSLSTTLARYPDAQFMTVLREPVSRLLSHHRYWQSRTPAMMQGWGRWAHVVHRADQALEVFLRDPWAACQTDNMTLRMLSWPHTLIPEHGFIDPRHDAALLEAALVRLDGIDWVDVVENRQMAHNLRGWLGRPFRHRHLNEASGCPSRRGNTVERDLSDEAFDLLQQRSRLDLVLWQHVARRRMPDVDLDVLRQRSLLRAVARQAAAAPPRAGDRLHRLAERARGLRGASAVAAFTGRASLAHLFGDPG